MAAATSVWAVVVAAGRGERLGSENPKAFANLGGRPLLAESLERLEASGWIEEIVVVAPPDWEEPAILLAEELGCSKVSSCVEGGATRAESARAGVGEVPADAAIILVHDAARPVLPEEVVERVIAPIGEGWDGAVPAIPLSDTIKRVRGDEVVETLDRSALVASQTPQAFSADVLRTALGGDVAGVSDCAGLVEAAGGRVKVVPGDPRLLKVTTAEDLAVVEGWIRS
jgi:2-C-methyl-D-erythritol 4-phosphate cytidylyltransferase